MNAPASRTAGFTACCPGWAVRRSDHDVTRRPFPPGADAPAGTPGVQRTRAVSVRGDARGRAEPQGRLRGRTIRGRSRRATGWQPSPAAAPGSRSAASRSDAAAARAPRCSARCTRCEGSRHASDRGHGSSGTLAGPSDTAPHLPPGLHGNCCYVVYLGGDDRGRPPHRNWDLGGGLLAPAVQWRVDLPIVPSIGHLRRTGQIASRVRQLAHPRHRERRPDRRRVPAVVRGPLRSVLVVVKVNESSRRESVRQ